ncbi:ABC transporter permease [Dyella sedimenti]|uniref:ABC transporter permease n=1 Tax=Dyella sedimenti TaxID=2919947 RepID=UPI001FA9F8C6|nr:ABC transporter permease [Dyella sedimenti]
MNYGASVGKVAPRWYLLAPLSVLLQNRSLYVRLVSRDVELRYKGSMLGVVWSMINPLALLAVFSFVFGVVMRARWGESGSVNFSLLIYSGLVLFILLSDVINKAPLLIIQNSNYVKKVVFPLEVLPAVTVGSALVNLALALLILLVGQLWFGGGITWTWLLLPVVLAPFVMMNLGLVFFLSSLGVYLRDIAQLTGIVVMVLMYMSPILYPVSMVPEEYRPWLSLNPLSIPVSALREITLYGQMPDWAALGIYALVSYVMLIAGFWWFHRTKNGFADVI